MSEFRWRYPQQNVVGENDFIYTKDFVFHMGSLIKDLPRGWYAVHAGATTSKVFIFDRPIKEAIEAWAHAGGYGGMTLPDYLLKIFNG